MTLSRARRALVIGGSMGGLLAAHLLLRRGWDVQVCERAAAPLSGRGAGIVTHDALRAALAAIGLNPGRDLGIPVAGRRTFGTSGAARGRVVGEAACPQVLTAWEHLFGLLREAFPDARYRAGRGLVSLEQDADGVRAGFSDGTAAEAELLVGADGIRSTARALLLPDAAPRYAGYVAWRGLVAEADLPPDLHAAVFDRFTFCLPPGEQMLGYPVAGPGNDLRPGHRRYNTVWYRPAGADDALPALLTDAAGRHHAHSIPPPLIAPASTAAMRADAARLLAPQFAELVRLTAQPFLQPIYDLESPRMALGRVALLGDAAFVARPHVGAGVSKAAEDAMALAAALDADPDPPAALQHFEAARRPEGLRIVARARDLGRCIAAGEGPDEAFRTPAAVMADTALLDFLRA